MTKEMIWSDKKRILGMPISFTRYSLSEDRFFEKTGFLSTKQNEALLYRVTDISISQSFGQKLFGVGNIMLKTADASTPNIIIKNVKHYEQVKERIYENVEKQKDEKNVHVGEFIK